jgi:DNA-binding transcriptional ArsR family regulator
VATTQDKVLKLAQEGKKPTEIAKKVKTTRNNVYTHLRKLREAGLLVEPKQAKSNGNGAAKRNGRRKIEKPDPAVEAAITLPQQDREQTEAESISAFIDTIRGQANEGANRARVRQAEIEDAILALEREHESLEQQAQELESIATGH